MPTWARGFPEQYRPAQQPGLSDKTANFPSNPKEAIVPKTLDDVAVTDFDNMIKHAYQGQEVLAGTVRVKTGVVGSSKEFNKISKGIAKRRVNPFDKVKPMGLDYDRVTATLLEYDASEWNSLWEATEVDFEEKGELAEAIRYAVERRKDQLILDAADALSTSLTVSIDQGGANTSLNMAKLRRGNALLDDKGVPSAERVCVQHVFAKEGMLGETQVTSADFNSVRCLVNGEVNSLLGLQFKWLESREEGGLPLTSNSRQGFIWHRKAIGLAVAKDSEVEVNYIPENKAWLNSQGYKAGAIGIDANGVAETATYEA